MNNATKLSVTISLFVFWAIVTSILTAGLIFYNNKNTQTTSTASTAGNLTAGLSTTGTPITLSTTEIAKHSTQGDCWLIINNQVYNVTNYLSSHPGGIGTITPYCGKEATMAFDTKNIGRPHSNFANTLLSNYLLGAVGATFTPSSSSSSGTSSGITTNGTTNTAPVNPGRDD